MEERKRQLIINKLRRGMVRLARSHLCLRTPPYTSEAQREPEEAENDTDHDGGGGLFAQLASPAF